MADISAALGIFTNFIDKTKSLTGPIDQVEKLNKVAGNVVTQFQKGIGAVENYVKMNAKLGLMTNSFEDHAKLQDKIFTSADKARVSYADMVDTVTKLGLSTGNLFKSNQEVVSFSELLQKSIVASGTSDDKKPVVMQQMADSMASGSMGSDDLLSIAQNAPVIYEAISKFTGMSGNDLLDMADKGELTAEKIKNSMFGMQAEIDNQLNQMPLTFTDIMNNVKNAGTDAFGNLFIAINDLITSQGVIDFFNGITDVINSVSDAIDYVIGIITDNGPMIESILMAIGLVLAGYIASILPVIIGNLVEMMTMLLANLSIFLMENLAIILIIAGIAAVIYFLRTKGEEIMSFIGGVIGVIGALFNNLFFTLSQLIIGIIEFWVNSFVAFVNFFANIFNDPIGAIVHLFFDLGDTVLGVIEKIASGIDFVFGSHLADTVKGWRADMKTFGDQMAKELGNGTYEKQVGDLDINEILNNLGVPMERMEYGKEWDAGNEIGGEFGKGVEAFFGGGSDGTKKTDPSKDSGTNLYNNIAGNSDSNTNNSSKDMTDTDNTDLTKLLKIFSSTDDKSPTNGSEDNPNLNSLTSGNSGLDMSNMGIDGIDNPFTSKNNDVGGSADVEMPEDDLGYLRDIAERDYIANVATNSLAPNISVQFGDVHENADANKVAGRIREILQNEIAVASEGVY